MKREEYFGEKLPRLGFGAMRFSTLKDGSVDMKKAREMVDHCMQNGVNYFDTAFNYHRGCSESVMGEALANYERDDYFLATKMPCWDIKDENSAPDIFAKQLKNCRVDYFDFYLMHNMYSGYFDKCKASGAIDYMFKMREEGRVKRLGLSIHDTLEGMSRILRAYEWDFVQLQINYLDWDLLNMKEQYAVARQLNLPVIVMEPVRGGTLVNLPEAAREILTKANPQIKPAEWALRFVNELPGIMTILSGMNEICQIDENIAALNKDEPFTAAEKEALKKAADAYMASGAIPCTACKYCLPCSFGVEIPTLFTMYNEHCVTDEAWAFSNAVAMLGKDKLASNCTSCGQCATRCPQRLDIPEMLAKVDGLTRKICG